MKAVIWVLPFIATVVLSNCDSNYSDGEIIYKKYCASCHMDDGTGLPGLIPPIAGADFLAKNRAELPCIIRYGLDKSIEVNGKNYGGQAMQGIPNLKDVEITNVLNWINTHLSNDNKIYSLPEVRDYLFNCKL